MTKRTVSLKPTTAAKVIYTVAIEGKTDGRWEVKRHAAITGKMMNNYGTPEWMVGFDTSKTFFTILRRGMVVKGVHSLATARKFIATKEAAYAAK